MYPVAPPPQLETPIAFGAPQFEVFFEMLKSARAEDGRVWVEGIASDQSVDLDGEIVKAAAYPKALEYLKSFGKFNFDHNKGIIGDVTEAYFITPTDALKKFGVMVKGQAVAIRGWFAPLDSAPNDPDLQELHKLYKSGSKLGFSMQGNYRAKSQVTMQDGRKVSVCVPGFIPQVAITPQPKNSNALCFAKSLASVLTGDAHPEETDGTSWPVLICPTLLPLDESAMRKALESTGIQAVSGVQGGDSLKLQDITGGVVVAGKTCATCDKQDGQCACNEAESMDDRDERERRRLLDKATVRKSARDMVEAVRLLTPR